MSRTRCVSLFLAVALTLAAQGSWASTAVTYVVGSCKPKMTSFATISDALAANPAASIIQVCPGTYPEQIAITQAVTLEGISLGNADQAVVVPPAGGLTQNATDAFADVVNAQILISNATGAVNISDLTIDATGHGVIDGSAVVGIFYQNSAGIVNRVTTRNQSGDGFGVGIWLEGGAANPSVTVENSSVHDFDNWAILAESNTGDSELTATITTNRVASNSFSDGIDVEQGASATVTNNIVAGGGDGIAFGGAEGTISGNTLIGNETGVVAFGDVAVMSNRIFNSGFAGILLGGGISKPAIQSNTIFDTPVGIDFLCIAVPDVHSNTIQDTAIALKFVPEGVVSANTYFNVGTIRSGC